MSDYEHEQAFGGVINVLEAIGAQYAIWGGVAIIAYGEPRFRHDMDILLKDDLGLQEFRGLTTREA